MVRIICGARRYATLVPQTRRLSERLLRTARARNASFELYLVDDRALRHTVLAYPSPQGFPRPDMAGRYLGELYLNPDRIARAKGTLAQFCIHGFLHLLRYDHAKRSDRITMEREERKLYA